LGFFSPQKKPNQNNTTDKNPKDGFSKHSRNGRRWRPPIARRAVFLTQTTSDARGGLAAQALATALQAELLEYYRLVTVLEAQIAAQVQLRSLFVGTNFYPTPTHLFTRVV
jgi:hypothetical protein